MNILPIRSVIALLTNQCNCACPYCFEARSPERMSLDTAKDILNFVKTNAGDRSGFTFFGGEPMLEFERIIVPLVEYSEQSGVHTRFAMTTNGTLLDKERIDWLVNHDISFMLSFDGNRETQELSRPLRIKESSFDAIMNFLPYLLEKIPHQSIRATLIQENIPNFTNDVLWLDSIGVKDFSVLPNFFETWDDKTKQLFLDELSKYNEYILSSYRNGKRPLLLRAYRAAFYEIPLVLRTKERRTSGNCITAAQCGFGIRGGASVDYRGDLYGCHHVPMNRQSPFYIGNVYDGIDVSRIEALTASYVPEKVGNEHCATCPIDKICNGGCVSNNYIMCGDVHKVSEGWCFWRQSIISAADAIMRKLADEDNALFLEEFKACLNGRAIYG